VGTSVWEHLQPLDTFGNGDELFPELQPSYGFGTEFAMLFDEAEHPRGQGGQFAKKEAHEMTRAEHGQEQESLKITTAALNKKSNALEKAKMEEWMNLEEDDRFGPVGTAIKEKYQSQIEAITDQAAPLWKRQKELAHPKNTVLDLANTHRRHVEVALAAGKHVPPEVLADYPDLDPGDKFQPDAYDKKTDSLEAYNDKTRDQKGNIIPAVITVYEDRSFTFITKLPPVSAIIKKTLGLKIASQKPGRETAGSLTMDQARDIAAQKLADLNTDSLDSALKTVMGTARSMGIKVI